MIKLVVSDMDGTLLNHSTGLSEKNLNAIRLLEKNNIEFAIASGRDYHGVYSIMQNFHINCEAILGNGAQYVDKQGNILISAYMNKSVVKDVLKIFEDRNIPYMIFTTKGFYTRYDPDFVRISFIERGKHRFGGDGSEYEKGGRNENAPCNQLVKIHDLDEFLNQDLEIIKVEAFAKDETRIPPTKELLKDIPTISFLSSFVDNVEVTDEKAQKGYILEEVIKIKGITHDEVAVLGDGMNDYSLFECFKYSFAPSNAEEIIKNMAYLVVGDCQKDGFSEGIDYLLNNLGD